MRYSDHRNASVRSSAVGIAGVRPSRSQPASQRASGFCPVSVWVRRWYSVSTQAVNSRLSSNNAVAVVDPGGGEVLAGGVGDLDEELFAHGAEESFDLAAALGRPGAECTSRIPSFAHARNSHASTNAEPLSTYIPAGTPRAASAGLRAAASRTVSSAKPNR